MALKQLVVGINDSLDRVILQFSEAGEILGDVSLDAAAAEAHIDALGLYRAQLKTPVAETVDPAGRIDAINNPAWMTLTTPHGPVLMVRHPGLGWVSFILPSAEARKLGEALIDLANRAGV